MSAKKEEKKAGSGHHYDASSIIVLEGLDPVRKRPGMYIGTTGTDGLHHLITEIFDNSRDEAMAGYANDIEIVLLPGNRVRVTDNGRGIPVDIHKQTKVSALETIMTTLHAGGKFGGEGYKVSGGLHGVGASVVNALSLWCEVIVHRDKGAYIQEYKQGKKRANVKKIGSSDMHGTIVSFEPDSAIFPKIDFDFTRIVHHMRQQAYLVKSLRISVIDARGFEGKLDLADVFYFRNLDLILPSETFYFEGGLLSFVAFNNRMLKPVHKNIFYVEKKAEAVESVEIALQYVDDIQSRVLAFANNTYNSEGGTHLTGFKTALTRTLNTYGKNNNIFKGGEDSLTGEDVLEGLTAVVSVKMREIQFEGQTKAKLGSVEAQSAVASVFSEAFSAFCEENPDDAKSIISKAILALKARKAAKAAKDSVLRKGALDGMTLPGKLADCSTRSAEESELFIVEGDSAGGCFRGDTRIALADGRDISFINLVEEYNNGKENYCYTIGKDGNINLALIENPRMTKKNAKLVKVVLDNNEEIISTRDHLFMLRDGSFKRARILSSSDSLMPLRRKVSEIGGRITIKGYEMVYDPHFNFWVFTHLLGDRFNLENAKYVKKDNTHVHHKDFNKLNNNPTNLVRMAKEDHLMYHREHLVHTIHRSDVKAKLVELHKTKEFREKIRKAMLAPAMRAVLSERVKRQWQDKDYKKSMIEKFLEFYRTNEEYRKENNLRLNKFQKQYWSKVYNRHKQSDTTSNFFRNHPERRQELRELALREWSNNDLRKWRSEKTKDQWTADFRNKRKEVYNQTYLKKALYSLHSIFVSKGKVDITEYNGYRAKTNDKSLLRFETIRDRFFGGDASELKEAVVNFNHRVKSVVPLDKCEDVYDLEVKGTHNFALASGVFVHNSAKQGRNRNFQAILPLRGKILNIERARLDKMLASEQIKNLVVALGTAISDTFDISKLRYHKIIIATDADVDGAHIRTLLLTLFYRYFKPLIEAGHIFIAQSPLYKMSRGKELTYLYSDEEKNVYLKKHNVVLSDNEEGEVAEDKKEEAEEEVRVKKAPKVSIQRYKGLGEMNPEELWETTMDPERRIMKKVMIEDAEEADKVFDMLMGDDVPARRSFIQSNAKMANLDI